MKSEPAFKWSADLHFVDAEGTLEPASQSSSMLRRKKSKSDLIATDSPLTGSCSVNETRDCSTDNCIRACTLLILALMRGHGFISQIPNSFSGCHRKLYCSRCRPCAWFGANPGSFEVHRYVLDLNVIWKYGNRKLILIFSCRSRTFSLFFVNLTKKSNSRKSFRSSWAILDNPYMSR